MQLAFQEEMTGDHYNQNLPENVDHKYNVFLNHVCQASATFFQQDTNNKKRKEWLTDEIMDIVTKKAKAFLYWQNSRGTSLESKHRNNYRLYRNLAKRTIAACQVEY